MVITSFYYLFLFLFRVPDASTSQCLLQLTPIFTHFLGATNLKSHLFYQVLPEVFQNLLLKEAF